MLYLMRISFRTSSRQLIPALACLAVGAGAGALIGIAALDDIQDAHERGTTARWRPAQAVDYSGPRAQDSMAWEVGYSIGSRAYVHEQARARPSS